MAERVFGVFNTSTGALKAAAALGAEGFPQATLSIMSDEPIHAAADESSGGPASLIGLLAVAGGVIGGAGALLLTGLASRRIGLVVGGMPIFTAWAFGIIVFELTALGAILAALLRMIFESRLARKSAGEICDRALARGEVVVAVACADEAGLDKAEAVLTRMSAEIVERS